jgi:M6 family metalloprotease-like protein
MYDREYLREISENLSYSPAQLTRIKENAKERNFRQNNIRHFLSEKKEEPDLRTITDEGENSRFLVILVDYADLSFITDQSVFDKMLNFPGYSDNGATGSARDFYFDNSFGKFIPHFDVIGPLKLSRDMFYYGENKDGSDVRPREMVIEACNLAHAAGVDFSQYDIDEDGIVDHVCVVFAGHNEAQGGGANTIWPHEWTIAGIDANFVLDGVKISTYSCSSELRGSSGASHEEIGTFCHEFGHALGLPDLYDTDKAENGTGFDPGPYATMASGSYNNNSKTPPFFSAFERELLGWHISTKLTRPASLTIPHSGINDVSYWYPTKTESGEENLKEFFYIENRQQVSWDEFIPGHGLMVYHIDMNDNVVNRWSTNRVNAYADHQCFDIEEADNIRTAATLDKDLFPAGALNKRTFSDITQPNSRSWAAVSTQTPLREITETEDGIITAVFISPTSSINTIKGSAIKCYSTDKILHIEGLPSSCTIELFDVLGKKVISAKVNQTTCSLPIEKQGIYVVSVSDGEESFTRKVCIE